MGLEICWIWVFLGGRGVCLVLLFGLGLVCLMCLGLVWVIVLMGCFGVCFGGFCGFVSELFSGWCCILLFCVLDGVGII